MCTKAAFALVLAVVVVSGCSRPWSKAELAPLSPQPYGQEPYPNSYNPSSRYSDPNASQSRYSDPYKYSQPSYSYRRASPEPSYADPYGSYRPQYSVPYARPQYGQLPPSSGYEAASPSNPLGPVSRPNQYY